MFIAVGTGLILHVRQSLTRELRQLRRVAGAAIGGDLYEVVATEYGVRAVMGDVRGHGIGALGTVAAVLGCFREAAHDEKDLGAVLRRLERALDRHLRQEHQGCAAEEFVTLLLVEIRPDGEMLALNCGHPFGRFGWARRASANSPRPIRTHPLACSPCRPSCPP